MEYIDGAQIAVYAFWLFFAGLIIYIRREDLEGIPRFNRCLRGKTDANAKQCWQNEAHNLNQKISPGQPCRHGFVSFASSRSSTERFHPSIPRRRNPITDSAQNALRTPPPQIRQRNQSPEQDRDRYRRLGHPHRERKGSRRGKVRDRGGRIRQFLPDCCKNIRAQRKLARVEGKPDNRVARMPPPNFLDTG